MIKLYTLPSCGICHMVKTKLNNKNIPFEEYNLNDYVNEFGDRAPVLVTETSVLYSPSEIVSWINQQE